MNTMHTFAANRETLLVLAWLAGQPNRESLKNKLAMSGDPSCLLKEQIVRQMPAFDLDRYGPLYRALFYRRLAHVNWMFIGGALSGRTQGVHLHQTNETDCNTETMTFWDIASQHPKIRPALRRLKRGQHHSSVALAELLRLHFSRRQPLFLRDTACSSLVQAMLEISLEHINWGDIEARLLDHSFKREALVAGASEPPVEGPEEQALCLV